FTNWLAQYQNSNCVEFRKVMHNNKSHHYADTIYYYCARHGTGGKKQYFKKHPYWRRKIPSKLTGCKATLRVKKYHVTSVILGVLNDSHNHGIGSDN
ncbi:hypothetical protein C8J56DRAFT_722930, partial [Mycena floridula]